jgi:hypothetical protein
MLMQSWFDLEGQRRITAERVASMQAEAEVRRLTRQAREAGHPRHVRRALGRMLIAAGQALEGRQPAPALEGRRPEPCI